MKNLIEIIKEAEVNKIAIGHLNISDIAGLKAVFEAAYKLRLPVIIGVSEGEGDFIGRRQIAALVKSLKEEYNYPIFLNADHTKSLEKIKEAVEAGFDSVMFDGSNLSLEENIKKTKSIVGYVKSVNSEILVEGEIGYIKGSSTILKASEVFIKQEDLASSQEAKQFVKETNIDLLAPAVGNIHGIITRTSVDNQTQINAGNPNLDIRRIKEIKEAVGIPLVLHGGSGIKDEEILAAIDAGISIVHINTELRLAWRKALEEAFKEKPEEIVPYKLLPKAVEEIKKVVEKKLRLFNKINE